MKQLWAPWRMDYIQGSRAGGCIFCLPASSQRDREHLVLHRGQHGFVIMNRYPYSNGHLMVAPRRHLADPALLSNEEVLEMHRLTVLCQSLLREVCRAQGFNVGMNLGEVAGAGVADHLHQHIVPRWDGDTNFMPIFADIRIVPQHLQETYRLLRQALAEHRENSQELR